MLLHNVYKDTLFTTRLSMAQPIGLCPRLGYGIRSNRSVHQQLPVNRVTYKLTNACRKISENNISTELYTLASEVGLLIIIHM